MSGAIKKTTPTSKPWFVLDEETGDLHNGRRSLFKAMDDLKQSVNAVDEPDLGFGSKKDCSGVNLESVGFSGGRRRIAR